jgi:hypothetical protein
MRMMSNRSPRLSVSPGGCLLFFRIAMKSTTPRHSPFPTPRKETNFQRLAIREPQGPEYGLRPPTGGMRFDVSRCL